MATPLLALTATLPVTRSPVAHVRELLPTPPD
jgi:hypothetical protein